jgi:UPF0176 protein
LNPRIHVTTCYRFKALAQDCLPAIQKRLEDYAESTGTRGLVLLGREGLNLTVSGTEEGLSGFRMELQDILQDKNLFFKNSLTVNHPFHVFKVKIKPEIVTLGRPGLVPDKTEFFHLSPQEWHQALGDPETVCIDTRNDYEVEIGKFKSALDFGIKEFRDFPEAMKNSGIPKEKKVLIYCTGGIRCEKAILELHNQGYHNVYQLDGGILNYLEKMPDQDFEGECFVFDYRVAVDQNLAPTARYKLCPHCGQPGELRIQCSQCGTETIICHHCEEKGVLTCSKNCEHHHAIGSQSRKPHSQELKKRHHVAT